MNFDWLKRYFSLCSFCFWLVYGCGVVYASPIGTDSELPSDVSDTVYIAEDDANSVADDQILDDNFNIDDAVTVAVPSSYVDIAERLLSNYGPLSDYILYTRNDRCYLVIGKREGNNSVTGDLFTIYYPNNYSYNYDPVIDLSSGTLFLPSAGRGGCYASFNGYMSLRYDADSHILPVAIGVLFLFFVFRDIFVLCISRGIRIKSSKTF